VILNHIN